ncbi:MAG: hypothetical protein Q8O03_00660 [Nanoarchaeota archaeon]|nr:hypothetical protein [Nanoarchaeota archaeon]
MDEEKAVKTLTAALVKHFESQVVQDDFYKEKLIKEAKYFFQFDDPFILGFDKFYMKDADLEGRHYRWGFVGKERTEKECPNVYSTIKNAIDAEEKYKDVNYFFIDKPEGDKDKGVNFFVTSYSIIGKKEAENLRRLFYKNVHPDIISAMHTLGLSDYTELYKLYTSNNMGEVFLGSYHAYLKLENMLANLDFERHDSNIMQSRIETLLGMGVEEFNKKLDKNVRPIMLYDPYVRGGDRFATKSGIDYTKNEAKTYPLFCKWINQLPDFFNFVFTLPLEDQNVETNKNILKLLAGNIDYVGILAKEYSNGKNFQEYFDCLDTEKQGKLVDSLKTFSERKPINDSFLWSKGFQDLSLDYLTLYQNKPEDFIDYFKTRTIEEKKVIIKDVMDTDFVNEKVIDWLNQHESDLIREVGLNG